jgi:hypothetical protein
MLLPTLPTQQLFKVRRIDTMGKATKRGKGAT